MQKGLFYWTLLEVVGFCSPNKRTSGMIWCILPFIFGMLLWDREGNHSSSLLDIFRVGEVVDILVYCASLFTRRTHDTACFINNSIKRCVP
jgi:hypothetical protein